MARSLYAKVNKTAITQNKESILDHFKEKVPKIGPQ